MISNIILWFPWISYWNEINLILITYCYCFFTLIKTTNIFKKLFFLFNMLLLTGLVLAFLQKDLFLAFLLLSELVIILYFYVILIYMNLFSLQRPGVYRASILIFILPIIIPVSETLVGFSFQCNYISLYTYINNTFLHDVYILYLMLSFYLSEFLILLSFLFLVLTYVIIFYFNNFFFNPINKVNSRSKKKIYFLKNIFFKKNIFIKPFLNFFKK